MSNKTNMKKWSGIFGTGRNYLKLLGGSLVIASGSLSYAADFQLLTWDDTDATVNSPSGVGLKPSSAGNPSDWLVFTGDDQNPGSSYNPQGATSHNFADLSGGGGSSFNAAPSLTGTLVLDFTPSGPNAWNVGVTGMSYVGQATPTMFMNQFLVTPGSPAALNSSFNVDGVGNSGTWAESTGGGWAIQYQADFYFATNADGDSSSSDVDTTFNNKQQTGYLLPVSMLNTTDLSTLSLNDPAGFFAGDFENYLLNEVAPRLPGDATYLLFTQMGKVNPDYAEDGLSVTTDSLIGNTTVAYTTAAIPEPSSAFLMLLAAAAGVALRRKKRTDTVFKR